ncbi:MAG: methionine biosynthesis protein MetW [Desulfurella sp.]|uniref:methionine biosynthesis protein MetW n=1 Tax=Desulfurella sp. TaxID=1962857 RepID=UPI003C8B09FE
MRKDFKVIFSLVNENSKVLDLGCGNGALLELLVKKKKISAKGIEIDSSKASEAIAKGISVYEGDMFEILPNYKTKSYDYVILSQTLQEVFDPHSILIEALRVGRYVIVSFPNFGYLNNRLNILFKGNIKNKELFDYCWHERKNFHPLTIFEFENYCFKNNIKLSKRIYLYNTFLFKSNPNIFAKYAVFVLEL